MLEPVRGLIDNAAATLPDAPELEVTVGAVEQGFSARHGAILVLSDGLEGPGIHHPAESDGPLPPLDRWRRAAIEVLRTLALNSIAVSVDRPPPSVEDWRWTGLALYMVDRVGPSLAAGLEGLATAYRTGSPGRYPSAGFAVMRALTARGDDPWVVGRQLIDPAHDRVLSPDEWLSIGEWVFEHVPALLPVPVSRVRSMDIPCALDAWRWQPLKVPAHARGGRIDVSGPGRVAQPWAPAGAVLRTLAAAADGEVQLNAHSGGPVGEWHVASAEGFGQVMGARGITFRFEAKGTLTLTFADAFVGPLAAVAMAEEVGTSGLATGRWSVASPWRVAFHDIDETQLTMHGRTQGAFRMPARGFGISAWLKALEEGPWAWQRSGSGDGERLVLRGDMLGGTVDVRLKKAVG